MNFIINENGYGHWKSLKKFVKNTLDSPQISRYGKILLITGLLEGYRKRYLDDKKA